MAKKDTISRLLIAVALTAILACCATIAYAGPPFFTDDPEPVEPDHWEFYLATLDYFEKHNATGTVPHIEINYGAARDLQLNLLVPAAYSLTSTFKQAWETEGHYGVGDTELGVKYRFVHETETVPQIGAFPLVELPTGKQALGLGNGKLQIFLPLWFQKSFGPWTTYGGGGYWLNWGKDNRNFGYLGWLGQRKIKENLALGAEVFHITPSEKNGPAHTGFNAGGTYDISAFHHILFSAGRDIAGPRRLTGYLGYQITF